jgi:hypothetical protein
MVLEVVGANSEEAVDDHQHHHNPLATVNHSTAEKGVAVRTLLASILNMAPTTRADAWLKEEVVSSPRS